MHGGRVLDHQHHRACARHQVISGLAATSVPGSRSYRGPSYPITLEDIRNPAVPVLAGAIISQQPDHLDVHRHRWQRRSAG